MRHALWLLAIAACGKDDEDDGKGGGGGTDPTQCRDIALTDEANYSFEGSLDGDTIVTAEKTDIEVCWDEVVQDLQCHEVDPAEDIDTVAMIRFSVLTEEQVEQGLSDNNLQQADISGYVSWENEKSQTCTWLSSLTLLGTPIDLASEYTEDGGTYLLTVNTGTLMGVGARSLVFLAPSVTSGNTEVSVPPGCGILEFDVDLESLDAVEICTEGPWTVDWSAITTDGLGNPIELLRIDKALLGFYEGMTAAQLEEQFLDIEYVATRMWSADLTGATSLDLTTLSDESGAFSGFSGDGLWVLALQCSKCPNPAPLFLTVLEPRE